MRWRYIQENAFFYLLSKECHILHQCPLYALKKTNFSNPNKSQKNHNQSNNIVSVYVAAVELVSDLYWKRGNSCFAAATVKAQNVSKEVTSEDVLSHPPSCQNWLQYVIKYYHLDEWNHTDTGLVLGVYTCYSCMCGIIPLFQWSGPPPASTVQSVCVCVLKIHRLRLRL